MTVEHGNEGDNEDKQVESKNEVDSAMLEMSVDVCVREKSNELFAILSLTVLETAGGPRSGENKRAADEYLRGGGMTDELETGDDVRAVV